MYLPQQMLLRQPHGEVCECIRIALARSNLPFQQSLGDSSCNSVDYRNANSITIRDVFPSHTSMKHYRLSSKVIGLLPLTWQKGFCNWPCQKKTLRKLHLGKDHKDYTISHVCPLDSAMLVWTSAILWSSVSEISSLSPFCCFLMTSASFPPDGCNVGPDQNGIHQV